MPRKTSLSLMAGLLAGLVALPPDGLAQSPASEPPVGAAAQQLIEQLRPRTRGIRIPGAAPAESTPDTAAVEPPDEAPLAAAPPAWDSRPAAGSTAESAPTLGDAAAARPGKQRPPEPPVQTVAAARPRLTTAPAGVPAASITVHFATGSATLTPEAMKALAPLAEALNTKTLRPYRFRIEGHTDTVGSVALNQTLSGRRALAVRELLVRHYGVDPARLEAVGYGDSQLLVATPPQMPEPANRRVQVLNLGG